MLQGIFEEVRLLRREMRRSAILQATLAQMQSAQANVDSLSRALQLASSRINLIREEMERTRIDLREAEQAFNHEDNQDQRKSKEISITNIKKRLDELPGEAQEMENREKELTDQLMTAQKRFELINKRFDELVRQLEVP